MNNKGESERSISDQSKSVWNKDKEELESSGVNKGNKGQHRKGNMRKWPDKGKNKMKWN